MNETKEMTSKQRKDLKAQEFKRKYQRYWLLYWGLFFTAALSFFCGVVLPFMRQDVQVPLNWGTALISAYFALGFLSIGEGAFNFWFDKVTDSDPDNGGQKWIAGVMIALSAIVSLSTALATSYIITWWIKIFDTFVRIPPWAQKYIAIAIPVMIIVNVVAAVMFKWVSYEAFAEREATAEINQALSQIEIDKARAKANYWKAKAPELAQQLGEIEAQAQIDALNAKIREGRRNLSPSASNVRQSYDYLMPPHGDRQHPDRVFARIPSEALRQADQAWLDYDNRWAEGQGSNGQNADPTNQARR